MPEAGEASGLIKEIILENFMSYEYARIPFKPGLNIICGPNGSGKSSILLALAVALGQTYTERSRRLSDLIRRGKDLARATVVFDNTPRNGRRPIPSCRSDTFVLSRYLNRNGTYWHEANFRTVTKGEVLRILSRLAINPDNMLIVMHQGMIDVFGAIDVRERLKMVEEAVGIREYREKILEAREKLAHTLSEEESIRTLLEKAEETLKYWESQYGRYLRKRELTEKRKGLELEHAWSKCIKQEEVIEGLLSKLDDFKRDLQEIGNDLKQARADEERSSARIKELDYDLESSYQKLITYERMGAEAEAELKLLQIFDESLRSAFGAGEESSHQITERLSVDMEDAKKRLKKSNKETEAIKSTLVKLKGKCAKEHERYVNIRVKGAILEFRRGLVERKISSLKTELRKARRELDELTGAAKQVGARVETRRKPSEILDEIKVVNAQLASLADVSPDVEKMYMKYKELLEELSAKAEIAGENRKRALEELELRKVKWRKALSDLTHAVGKTYKEILGGLNATGDVRVVNPEDIDEAGLELHVGFMGSEPRVLDAYTQSGGERTSSIMCFLLALQQHIKSPIRAVDEFDIHMDPRNRERLMRQLMRLMGARSAQCLLITPRQLPGVEGVSNVITVQNVAGVSSVKVVA